MSLPRRTFYMARHGETEDNASKTVTRKKVGLTPRGICQAQVLRSVIETVFENPNKCYLVTAKLNRARWTGGLATPQGWAIHANADDRLNERSNGNMAGRASYGEWFNVNQQARSQDLSLNDCNFVDYSGDVIKIMGCEEISQHKKRVNSALTYHLKNCPPEKIPLFICHEGTMRRTQQILSRDEGNFSNGGLYKFTPHEHDQGWDIHHVHFENGKIIETPYCAISEAKAQHLNIKSSSSLQK